MRLGGALVGAALLGACALDTSATSAWEAVETDLRSPSVVISPAARASSARPTVLVYLAGHLRTFLLIAPQMKALLDSMAGGPDGYVVYMHTWDELDHRDAVWWRRVRARALRTGPTAGSGSQLGRACSCSARILYRIPATTMPRAHSA